MFDYESPITQIIGEMQTKYENGVLKAVQGVGFHVNKEELTKALVYDRGQYEKGYKDGLNASGWIPFTQREMTEDEKESCEVEEGYMLDCPLPEEDEEILVTYSNGTVDVDTFMRDGHECYLDSGNELVTEAVAWMRKPAPYQKGD